MPSKHYRTAAEFDDRGSVKALQKSARGQTRNCRIRGGPAFRRTNRAEAGFHGFACFSARAV